MPSSASVTGDETTYPPLAHFPKSIVLQRSLQKGKSAAVFVTGFLQIGHLSSSVRLRGMVQLYLSRKEGGLRQDLRYQIVVVGLGDLATIKFARLRFTPLGKLVHKYFAVDLGSMHGSAAFQQKISFFGFAFK